MTTTNYHFKMMKTKDIRKALYKELLHSHIRLSGHKVNNGEEYVELRNVVFTCDKDYIIDAPEYEELQDGTWYVNNYEPRIMAQVKPVIGHLVKNHETRHAILSFYDPDKDLMQDDMICTMYVSMRLEDVGNIGDGSILYYTVHMRSSDIREFRSDLKFHKRVRHDIALALQEETGMIVAEAPITWYADSLQCWDKDWEFLRKE